MLISEYLQMRNIAVTTGNHSPFVSSVSSAKEASSDSPFAKELKSQLEKTAQTQGGVEFSKHAIDRLSERNIDIYSGNTLERLNKAVELAEQKGSSDTLVIVDSNAFVVSVKNNKVITTMPAGDMQGNIFTNIDSTVIM
jgi:flagellar operon protein